MHPWHDSYVDEAVIATGFPVVIEIPKSSKNFADFTDKSQLPAHLLREVQRFFQDYKALEHKQVMVQDLLGPAKAVGIINDALDLYRRLRRGGLKASP